MNTKTAPAQAPAHDDDTMPSPADPSAPAQWNSLYVSLLETLRPTLDALDVKDLVTPNVDIPAAITTARGAIPALQMLRPRVLTLGGEVNLVLYDSVLDYARLLHYAHSSYLATIALPDMLPQLNQEGIDKRDALLGGAGAFVAKGLLPKAFITQVRTGSGYEDTSTDLLQVTSTLRAIWKSVDGHTLIEPAELDEADHLAEKITEAVAMRTEQAELVSRRVSDRQLAFTLFSRAYDEARRVTSFLLWNEGTADKLVPSLYAGRGGARRKESAPPADDTQKNASDTPKPAGEGKPAQEEPLKPGESVPPNQSSPFASSVKK